MIRLKSVSCSRIRSHQRAINLSSFPTEHLLLMSEDLFQPERAEGISQCPPSQSPAVFCSIWCCHKPESVNTSLTTMRRREFTNFRQAAAVRGLINDEVFGDGTF